VTATFNVTVSGSVKARSEADALDLAQDALDYATFSIDDWGTDVLDCEIESASLTDVEAEQYSLSFLEMTNGPALRLE
jgi:hypothetical protein